ncbi:MAG: protein-disulfide isomerase [Gammaproteobacteria bacterium]|nr:protein-disulfide isomerase [Gammaproteobacteria bacterium]
MKKFLYNKAPAIGALFVCLSSLSIPLQAQTVQSSMVDDTPEVAAIREVLLNTQNGIVIQSVVPSPVEGLYEVRIQNGPAIYASADAQFFIPGDLYQATQNGLVNLGESRRNEMRLERLAAIDEADMIIFPAEGEEKAVLTVFTDVDCQYCRQLHSEMPEINEYGITIRYLAFPRSGLDQVTYPKMVSTWCAEQRNVIFTTAIRGAQIAPNDCDNPVAEQYQMGREFGVTGTPTLVFEDGSMVPGYIPVDDLAAFLLGDQ